MITKKQKIWMWIFLAMFIVPEILWGNIIKVLKVYFLPIYKSTQFFTNKPMIAILIIIIEITGMFGIFYLLNKKSSEITIKLRYALNVVLIIILLIISRSLFLSYAISQISFF